MSCIHHQTIVEDKVSHRISSSTLSTLRISCTSPVSPLSFLFMTITDHFSFCTTLLSPQWHNISVTQHVDFSDWYLSLSSVHSSIFHVFSWHNSSFLLLNHIPFYGAITVCLFTYLSGFSRSFIEVVWLLPVRGYVNRNDINICGQLSGWISSVFRNGDAFWQGSFIVQHF